MITDQHAGTVVTPMGAPAAFGGGRAAPDSAFASVLRASRSGLPAGAGILRIPGAKSRLSGIRETVSQLNSTPGFVLSVSAGYL